MAVYSDQIEGAGTHGRHRLPKHRGRGISDFGGDALPGRTRRRVSRIGRDDRAAESGPGTPCSVPRAVSLRLADHPRLGAEHAPHQPGGHPRLPLTPPRETRAGWILTGIVIGAVIGAMAMAWMVAWGTFFPDERITSALVIGVVVVGAGGWFLLTYDHSRRQEVIDDTRRELARWWRSSSRGMVRTENSGATHSR